MFCCRRSGGVFPSSATPKALMAKMTATTRNASLNDRTHAWRLAADASSAAAFAVAAASSASRLANTAARPRDTIGIERVVKRDGFVDDVRVEFLTLGDEVGDQADAQRRAADRRDVEGKRSGRKVRRLELDVLVTSTGARNKSWPTAKMTSVRRNSSAAAEARSIHEQAVPKAHSSRPRAITTRAFEAMHQPPDQRQRRELRNGRPHHQLRDFQRPVSMHARKELRHEIGDHDEAGAKHEVEPIGRPNHRVSSSCGAMILIGEKRATKTNPASAPALSSGGPDDDVALKPEPPRAFVEHQNQRASATWTAGRSRSNRSSAPTDPQAGEAQRRKPQPRPPAPIAA